MKIDKCKIEDKCKEGDVVTKKIKGKGGKRTIKFEITDKTGFGKTKIIANEPRGIRANLKARKKKNK